VAEEWYTRQKLVIRLDREVEAGTITGLPERWYEHRYGRIDLGWTGHDLFMAVIETDLLPQRLVAGAVEVLVPVEDPIKWQEFCQALLAAIRLTGARPRA